uniref:Uncharacterized protein n=1 Tax=Sphaerodactylus townsendi TaxID=933632 RepID=A0ACB8F1X0_9SAUR
MNETHPAPRLRGTLTAAACLLELTSFFCSFQAALPCPHPLFVYPPNSGDDYSREPAGYAPSKPPSTVYPGAFYMPDGLHNSTDLWSSSSTMGQSNYGSILGASSSPLPQSGNFGGLHQHERMNYQMHSGEVNGGLPSVSGFSSASTQYGVSSHTPPIGGTESVMGWPERQDSSRTDLFRGQ